ncbi:MAG: 2-dehydro-3-deoxygalactonokinase [Clostridiaceae bacterium]
MAKYIVTIDMGTTNTRICVWDKSDQLIDYGKYAFGVRDTLTMGDTNWIEARIEKELENLMEKLKIKREEIHLIVASGMITSNLGLIEVPHLVAPVGLDDLASSTFKYQSKGSKMEIYLIPGIKNNEQDFPDMMRGEEVEASAVLAKHFNNQPMLILLPGSHNKIVAVDKEGRITKGITTLAGELLSVITKNTILTDSLGGLTIDKENVDRDMMKRGYEDSKRYGLGRTCFNVRLMDKIEHHSKDELKNYLLGAVLESDIRSIMEYGVISEDTQIVVAPNNYPIGVAYETLLEYMSVKSSVIVLSEEESKTLSSYGAYRIARKLMIEM